VSAAKGGSLAGGLLEEAGRVDLAIYAAIAETDTPALDEAMRALSSAADYSRISLATAAALAVGGGRDGRRAAVRGLGAIAVTATIVNAAIKPLLRRSRPDRVGAAVPEHRHVAMPVSASFPSGHSAAAFAFAGGAASVLPAAALPLSILASLVAYSRVHTGVHYPGDVVAGALCGLAVAAGTNRILEARGR
jgi:membrane-associated phospholipid phosphatase